MEVTHKTEGAIASGACWQPGEEWRAAPGIITQLLLTLMWSATAPHHSMKPSLIAAPNSLSTGHPLHPTVWRLNREHTSCCSLRQSPMWWGAEGWLCLWTWEPCLGESFILGSRGIWPDLCKNVLGCFARCFFLFLALAPTLVLELSSPCLLTTSGIEGSM